MRKVICALNTLLFLVLPGAVTAQTFTIETQSTSSVSYKLQQFLLQPPSLPAYLLPLIPSVNNDAIEKLEAMLLNKSLFMPAPLFGTSTATTTNQVLIQALLEQVTLLQQQIDVLIAAKTAATSSSATSTPLPSEEVSVPPGVIECPKLSRAVGYGANGNDIVNLQLFLASEGLLETSSATGFFGKLTEAAVQAWQKAKGIISEGSPETTGWGLVGPKTRSAFAACR